MRDVNRLYSLYEDMRVLHSNFPDWRFMQLMLNFLNWHYQRYGSDGYYIEDPTFLDRFREFFEEEGLIKDEDN